ncbi:MAG: sugar ABC transporter permease [Chloroflexi bacterium]|nr:sugar ABC transporter permease [Chloroflexota bacterium]
MHSAMTASPSLTVRFIKGWRRYKWSYFFIAPSMILFFIFIAYPVLQAFLFAFQKVDLRGSSWVGLKNFTDLASSKLFWATMQHTAIYAFFVVVAWIVSSMAVAALIQPLSNRVQSLFRGAFYLPNVVSIIVISLVWIWIFHPEYGFLNYLLSLVGLGPVYWLQNPDIALWAIILSTVLIVPGSGVVLYSAAIGSIPPELYEAAEVEGANAFQKWLSITIPLLKPTTLYLMVIYTIAGFQIFERVYIMTGGGPINSTMTIVQLIYQTAFSDFNYGRASAEALILFAIIASISVLQFKFLSSDVEY